MRLASKPGTMRSLPMMSGKRSARAPSTSSTVAATLEADDRVVLDLGGAILDRHEHGLLVAQLVDDGFDLLVGDLVDLGREGEAGVVAELDLRPDRQRHVVRRRPHPPRSSSTRARAAAPGRPGRLPGGPAGRCARRGARGPRRRWGWATSGSERSMPRARSRIWRGALPGRKPGTRVRRARCRTPSSMACWSSWAVISTSSTMVLRSPSRMSVFTASLFIGWVEVPREYRETLPAACVRAGGRGQASGPHVGGSGGVAARGLRGQCPEQRRRVGAGDRSRTCTTSRSTAPKAAASAIPPPRQGRAPDYT